MALILFPQLTPRNMLVRPCQFKGIVAETKVLKNDEAFLRIGQRYPHQLSTGYIASLKAVADQAWLKSFSGRTVSVYGRIDVYAGKPEIKITSREQVKLIR
jgi:hypothetical protein